MFIDFLILRHAVSLLRTTSVQTVAVFCALVLTFGVFEPVVSYGFAATSSTFTIRQTVTDEISFTTPGTTTTMTGSIAGISGGEATGTTQVVVRSNSFTGYTMDISFSGAPAMRGITYNNQNIRDYATGTQPSFAFIASTSAQFGYSITASNTADVAQSFLNNGTGCNAVGGSSTFARCWAKPSTTNFRIINKTTSAATGATTTITFRVVVPANPAQNIDADTYQATATLTATNQ
jgi:hypothetical protein